MMADCPQPASRPRSPRRREKRSPGFWPGLLWFLVLAFAVAPSATLAQSAEQQAALVEAKRLSQEAIQLYQAGKLAETEQVLKRVLEILEKALGPDDPNVFPIVMDLAALYNAQGQYAQDEPLHRRALAIREKVLRSEHPDVATSLENYAALLRKINRAAEAEGMEDRAKAIRAKHAEQNPTK